MPTKEQHLIWTKRYLKKHPEQYKKMLERKKIYNKEKYKSDPEYREKCKRIASEYWHKNKEAIKERRRNNPNFKERQRAYNRAHRMMHRSFWLRSKYGITLERYDELLKKQNNVCAICGNPQMTSDKWGSPHRRLRVDHNHVTKNVRGLLCHNCNAGLGHFRDSPNLLKKAIEYLSKEFMGSSC